MVNNVGGTIPNALLDTDPGYLEEAFHFNVSTAHALTRAAVPQMLKNDGGSIVNISSVVGRVAGRGYLAYGTAKAALAHYTRLAAQDLSPTDPGQRDRGRQRDDQRPGVRRQRRARR